MARKKKDTLTPHQTWEKKLQLYIKNNLEYLPEPTYSFTVGDSVNIGYLEDVVVCGVFENGKIYEIDYTKINNNYGKPIKHKHQKMFVRWLDIRPHQQTQESFIKNDDLKLHYSQRTMDDILGKAYSFGTDLEPDYQRGYVWELSDKIALIDSVFNNIDIGKFAFIYKGTTIDGMMYEILDGKQRIRAILDYYENRFSYKNKYFNDLSKNDQRHIKNYAVSIAEIGNATKEQILRYFVSLNKRGKVMDEAHILKVEKMLEEQIERERAI